MSNLNLNPNYSYDQENGINIRKNRVTHKPCARPGCPNLVINHRNKHYCADKKCQSYRDKDKRRVTDVSNNVDNRIIEKDTELIGTSLTLPCEFPGCELKMVVPYKLNRRIYPKYCDLHRNQYHRERLLDARREDIRQQSQFHNQEYIERKNPAHCRK